MFLMDFFALENRDLSNENDKISSSFQTRKSKLTKRLFHDTASSSSAAAGVKSSSSPSIAPSSSDTVLSGVVHNASILSSGVTNANCSYDFCSFFPDTDFLGGDLLNMPAKSKDQCCDFCHSSMSCKHFTFFDGYCFLKGANVQQKTASLHWGGKSCGNTSWKLPFASNSNSDSGSSSGSSSGGTGSVTKIVSPSNSGSSSSSSSNAAKEKQRYPFTPDMKFGGGGGGGFLASLTSLFSSSFSDHSCCSKEDDIDFSGGDLEFERVDSWERCCETCSGDKRCKTWSFVDGICYLKHSKISKTSKSGVISGVTCQLESPTPLPPPLPERENPQEAIRNAMKHAWDGYANLCFGQDELKPLSETCGNWLGSGLTIIDAMSTLHLMNLTEEFTRAKNWLAQDLKFDYEKDISFFETVIRIMGGLLSAYDFTREIVFLQKAHQLADALMPAFDSASGLPWGKINMATKAHSNPTWSGRASVLAEIGTIQLEYFALSHHLNDSKYENLAQHIVDLLQKSDMKHKGLYPLFLDTNSGRYKNQKLSFGGCGDSFYEYLLKVWLQTNRTKVQYQTMYVESINAMIQHMLKKSSQGYWYLPSFTSMGSFKPEMEHLTCFTPGMMALGSVSGIMDQATAARHMQVAQDLVWTCYQSYQIQNTGVGPESSSFEPNFRAKDAAYNMRPETIESLFYLWRITKDPKYRDWGWNIFVALERWCRRPVGYSGIVDVRAVDTGHAIDRQESFFLAETLKYLYLLFSDDEDLPLMGIDDLKPNASRAGPYWIFNTEAHPLRAWNP